MKLTRSELADPISREVLEHLVKLAEERRVLAEEELHQAEQNLYNVQSLLEKHDALVKKK